MKFCPKCGTKCQDSMKFCQNCGSPLPEAAAPQQNHDPYQNRQQNQYQNPYQNQYQNYAPVQQKKSNGLAVASLVLGIVGFITMFIAIAMAGLANMPLAIIFLVPSMLAIVFGVMAIMKCRKDPTMGGFGLAIAGLILGALFLLIGLVNVVQIYQAYSYLGVYGLRDLISY